MKLSLKIIESRGVLFIMKKIFAIMFTMIFATMMFAGCGSDAKKADVKPIIIGLDDNFPPMGFKNEKDEIVGFDIDLANEVVKRLGKKVEFKPIDWSSKEAQLKSGRISAIWNGLNITPEREKNMAFSKPYMESKQLIFVRKGEDNIQTPADLKGKVIGMQSGSTAEINLENDPEFAKTLKDVKKYADCIAAMMDLSNGRVDAIVTDEIVGRYYMSKRVGEFEVRSEPVGPVGSYGIGFAKDNTELRDEIQVVLDEMKKDGASAKISTKWFGADILY